MKKFFGILALIFCVFLASCNFNSGATKTGSIDFVIPVNEIIQASVNQARDAGTDGDSDAKRKYIFLVQIKGSKKYYDSQTRIIEIPENALSMGSNTTSGGEPNKDISAFINKDDLYFSFKKVPLGQTYSIMFDAFFELPMSADGSPIQTQSYIISGRTDNVKVSGRKGNYVQVEAGYSTNCSVNTRVEFADGTNRTFVPLDQKELERIAKALRSNGGEKEELQKQREELIKNSNLTILVKGAKLYYSAEDDSLLEVKDIIFEQDSSKNNFTASPFKYNLTFYDNPAAPVALQFSKNQCSIKQILLGFKTCSSQAQVEISNDTLSFTAELPSLKFDTTQDYGFEEAATLDCNFVKKDDGDANRLYVYQKKLSDIINQVPQAGDTVLLLLKAHAEDGTLLFLNTQLYYKLTDKNFLTEPDDNYWGQIWEDNKCINYKQGKDLDFVIPLNFIENPDNNLLFYLTGGEVEEETVSFTIKSLVLPADKKVFAFTLGAGNGDDKYRYEYNTPITDILPLSGGETVKVDLHGTFAQLNWDDNLSEPEISYQVYQTLDGEIYDGAEYSVEGENDFFHPLSDDQYKEENVKILYTSSSPNGGTFVFKSIKAPKTGIDNNLRFQCSSSISDYSSGTLLIYDYELTFSKE